MLDENLPTFQFRQSSDNPLNSVVYFTRNGSEPAPEYVFKRAHPSINPAASKKYAVGLADPYASDVVYAEVIVSPEWQQPTLSAAEVRAQQGQGGGGSARPALVPLIPDNFTIQLYDPDQLVTVKYIPGSLTKTDTWEFEMLSQSFKMPSASQLDRQNGDEPVVDFRPRNMFKWKKDGRLTKDMTCYNVGKSVGKHKSKDPDITVALFKQGKETAVTVYEPNLQRIEMEDRKGLDIVLVIGAEVIRDLYLSPEKRPDLFNIGGAGAPIMMANGRRKNSKPTPPPAGLGRVPTAGPTTVMSGALNAAPAAMSTANVASYSSASYSASSRPSAAQIDAETERLRAQVEKEERMQMEKEARERERRDKEEQKRIERMLKEEEKERRRREAEVAAETERLKKMYGTQGQDLLPNRSSGQPQQQQQQFQGGGYAPPPQQPQHQHSSSWSFAPPPDRPVSAGPANYYVRPTPPQQQQQPQQQAQAGPSRPGRKPNVGPYLSGANPAAAVSGFFQSVQNFVDPKTKKVTKKKSMQW